MFAFGLFGAIVFSMYALGVWHTAVPGTVISLLSVIFALSRLRPVEKRSQEVCNYVFRIKSSQNGKGGRYWW